jgi:hypothetical protein
VTDILDEVLNDTKEERRMNLFFRIFPIVITLAIIGIIGVAVYNWYKTKSMEHNQQIGDVLIELVLNEAQNDNLKNNSLEQIIKNKKNEQSELAELQLVTNLLDSNNNGKALRNLEAVINNKNYSEITTSYARLLWLGVILDQKNINDEDQARAKDYMDHFDNNNQVFFSSMTLIKALFYKKMGQKDKALEYAELIMKQNNASAIIKEQARALLSGLTNNL